MREHRSTLRSLASYGPYGTQIQTRRLSVGLHQIVQSADVPLCTSFKTFGKSNALILGTDRHNVQNERCHTNAQAKNEKVAGGGGLKKENRSHEPKQKTAHMSSIFFGFFFFKQNC
eukprot:m.112988 g.112988  ORF g.112988 m.112988 type:complete len:116 (-) comp16214_c0_seq6:32-379(-)